MKRVRDLLPSDLEPKLEQARLDLLALFRSLDRLDLTADEIPQHLLHDLFELDADFAEALQVLAWPTRGLDVQAMLADTLASLRRLAPARQQFVDALAPRAREPLAKQVATIRPLLTGADANHSIPRAAPQNR